MAKDEDELDKSDVDDFLIGSNDEVFVVIVDDVAVVDVVVDDFDVSRFIFVRRFWNHTLICKRKSRHNLMQMAPNCDPEFFSKDL